jgi:hypothetical protein
MIKGNMHWKGNLISFPQDHNQTIDVINIEQTS